MVLAVAFIQGFKYEIREKLFSFWGHVIVTNYSQDAADFNLTVPIRYDSNLVTQIRQLPYVKQVIPFIVRPGIIKTSTDMEGIKLKGISDAYRFPEGMEIRGAEINFKDPSYSKEIILSQTTANKLNLKINDFVQLYFIERGSDVPRIRKVKIAGVFHTGMEEVDKNYALCDIRMLQQINIWQPDDINGYQVDLTDEQYMTAVSDTIFNNFIGAPLHSYTMKEVYVNVFDWLQLQNLNAQIVLIIMVIVAIINLAVATVIIIVEHARTVGILKALGMPFKNIMKVFLYHSLIIAFAGILLGNLLALLFCWLQLKTGFLKLNEATYYMKYVPVRINLLHIFYIDAGTLFCCVLFMWLPTLYIRKIQPVKVLQFK